MTDLATLGPAFRRCVGELGMWSAARLFVSTARKAGGEDAIEALRLALGAEFPVLDVVATEAPVADAIDAIVSVCEELLRLVVVGIEADCLGPLVDRVPRALELALILDPTFPADLERMRAAWGDRLTICDLASFQRYAGSKSALLTSVYGADDFHAVVTRAWLRCHGDDVRTQFGRLIGWNVLGAPMDRYPRWLVETDVADFTDLIGARV